MGAFDEIQQLIQLTGAMSTGKMDQIYESIAQQISTASSRQFADAITELRSVGEDPKDWIAKPRSVARQQAQELRDQQAAAKQAKLDAIEIQVAQDAADAAKAIATGTGRRVK